MVNLTLPLQAKALNLDISAFLWSVLSSLRDEGYTPFLVGGCVRDALLGEPDKDKDVIVQGITIDRLETVLQAHGHVDAVGKAHGILKFRGADDQEYDFSVPRRDSKIGVGHKGFRMEFDGTISLEEDAARRDFTVNALFYDPFTEKIYDFFGGIKHLEQKLLVATSDAFADDPLRVLRGLQFSCRFGMRFEERTLALCRRMAGEFHTLSEERFAAEWMKLVCKGKRFDHLFQDIVATGLEIIYPELAAMIGVPQEPEWHPEGPCDIHVAHVLNWARGICDREGLQGDARATLMLAALCHDIAKPATTQQQEKKGVLRWTSHGHEAAGGPMTRELLRKIGIKRDIVARVVPLVENHMAVIRFHGNGKVRLADVRKLALDVSPASLQELAWVMEADHSGRPPLQTGLPPEMRPVLELAQSDGCFLGKPVKVIEGRHVMPFYFGQGGTHIGEAVTAAYAAQVAGKFTTEEEGLRWLRTYLRNKCCLVRGEDVMAHQFQPGPQVGAVLDQAWSAQLAGMFHDREAALLWLDGYLRSA